IERDSLANSSRFTTRVFDSLYTSLRSIFLPVQLLTFTIDIPRAHVQSRPQRECVDRLPTYGTFRLFSSFPRLVCKVAYSRG
ncbi:hypothetical protein TSAR_003884, partial [Trichomalopsis sarcophagae]